MAYLTKQSFLFYKRIEYLEKGKIQQKKLTMFLYTLIMKRYCGFKQYFKEHHISTLAVYGIGMVYEAIEQELLDSVDIKYFVDKRRSCSSLNGKPVIRKEDIENMEKVDAILVTAVGFFHEIEEELEGQRIKDRLIDIEDIIYYDKEKRKNDKDLHNPSLI